MLRNILGWLAVLVLLALISVAMFHVGYIQHWLAVHTGTVNESGPYYGFFSGFGSDLGELTLFAGLVTAYRHINCHSAGCWRMAKLEMMTEHGPVKVCRKCHLTHPDKPMTREELHASHRRHLEREVQRQSG